jgi:hypothetical protein
VIGYVTWVERVLRLAIRERPTGTAPTFDGLVSDLAPLDGPSVVPTIEMQRSVNHVLDDLEWLRLIDASQPYRIMYPSDARRFRNQPLASVWSSLPHGYLERDEEAFLEVVAHLSEQPGEAMADVADVSGDEVALQLSGEWTAHRVLDAFRHLKEQGYVDGQAFGQSVHIRITYASLIRAGQRPPDSLTARHVGLNVRNATELQRRFCEWRTVDKGKVTRARFAEELEVSDATVGRWCRDYRQPWKVLKRLVCPPG